MSDIRVQRAAIGDEATLRQLRLQAMTEAPAAFSSTYEREAARTTADWQRWLSPGATFLAYDGGEARGLVACARDRSDPAVVELMAMWVDPTLRGSGAADALVSAVAAWAAAAGAREVRLQVVKSNARARRCYERNGFSATGRESAREKDGAPDIEMARRL